MIGLLAFHRIAALRGDGLHPVLRQLLEQRAAFADPEGTVVDLATSRPGLPAQAGPSPPSRRPAFTPGNVIGFDPAMRLAVSIETHKTLKK